MKSDCQRRKPPYSMAYMHRGVISSIGDPPPGIGVYLGALAAILRLLKSVTGLRWQLYVHC